MAKLCIEDLEFELADDSSLQQTCEGAGIPFGCTEGICGTCRVEVTEGSENLSPRTQEEDDMGLAANERLACQCKIKSGTVKMKPW